jgi:hypothetical protein
MPGGGKPYWTAAESAFAAGGCPRHAYIAARYTYAGDDSVKSECRYNLMAFCAEQQTKYPYAWPGTVLQTDGSSSKYLQTLVDMHLDEERTPSKYRDSSIYAILLSTTERIWSRKLSPLYVTIRHEWLTWQSHCFAVMQSRINEHF